MSFFTKLKEVFSKEYKKKIEYRKYMQENIGEFKLKSEERDDLSKRLKSQIDSNFQSNFQIKMSPNLIRDEERDS